MAEPDPTAGQVDTADQQATAPASGGDDGQSANPAQTTASGSDAGQVESFFDPRDIEGKPELQSAYKQMQADYTRGKQALKREQAKVDAYNQFLSDPQGTLRQLAGQYGYNLVQGAPESQEADDSPKTWDDVYSRAKQEVLSELNPVIGEVKRMKQQNVESYLDNSHPDWRQYEDRMLETLQEHPTLAHDPDKLYQLSVPSKLLEERAMKAAMAKLRSSSDSGQISGASATIKQSSDKPDGPMDFNTAVAYAKAKLAKQGIRP